MPLALELVFKPSISLFQNKLFWRANIIKCVQLEQLKDANKFVTFFLSFYSLNLSISLL